MRRSARGFMLASTILALSGSAKAADFYVDPQSGAASNPGTAAAPWKTLEEVVSAGAFGSTVKAGDTVHLRDGYHGELDVSGGDFNPAITIAAEAGQVPKLRRVRFSNTSGWVVRGVSVSPSYGSTSGSITMVEIEDSTTKIVFEDSEVFSVADSGSWGVSEWLAAHSGVSVGGADVVVKNNKIKNVRFGISVDGLNALIDHNTVENFSADGLRGLGDNETFQYNVVKNSYLDDDVDTNHDDGFQSWSVGANGVGTGEVKNLTLRGNVIINAESASQPLKGTLQGIGCFDGFYVGWVVENNVVITNHWHGISLYGARDSRVVNNTVIDNESGQPGPPWIMVTEHKDGTPSQNVIVRNNLATDYDVGGTNVADDHNTELTAGDLATYFVNPAGWDLHLLQNAPAVDQGSADQAPALDADLIPRPQGGGIDLGAYEWHDPSVVPVGGTGGGAAGSANGGSAGGGATSNGGSSAGGTGGKGGANAGGAKSGGAGAKDSDDSGGCGCRAAGAEGNLVSTAALAWLVVAGFAHARASTTRRSRQCPTPGKKSQRAR